MSTVLVGYLPTEAGAHTLDVALQEAAWRQATLLVINFVRNDVLADPDLMSAEQEHALRELLDASSVSTELQVITDGNDFSSRFLDIADEREVELIVIGLRHRTSVGKLLMGSSAQRILMGAPCSVLGVRPKT